MIKKSRNMSVTVDHPKFLHIDLDKDGSLYAFLDDSNWGYEKRTKQQLDNNCCIPSRISIPIESILGDINLNFVEEKPKKKKGCKQP